jgi:hypothetical protein
MPAFHLIHCFRNLFTVQTTPPISPYWRTVLWGGVGIEILFWRVISGHALLAARRAGLSSFVQRASSRLRPDMHSSLLVAPACHQRDVFIHLYHGDHAAGDAALLQASELFERMGLTILVLQSEQLPYVESTVFN